MARIDRYWDGHWMASVVLGKRKYLVGRDPACDLVLEDPKASRRHFELEYDADEDLYILQDLDTPNGTMVNGVKEFRCKLRDQSAIQVGEEFLLFLPHESREAPPDEEGIPRWATLAADDPLRLQSEPTSLISPAQLSRMQARIRARSRPHLLMRLSEETLVFSLDRQVTPIGFGPVRASLGPSKNGREKVLAEIVRLADGRFKVKAKGLLGRVEVDGESKRERILQGGEELVIGDIVLEFHKGLVGRKGTEVSP